MVKCSMAVVALMMTVSCLTAQPAERGQGRQRPAPNWVLPEVTGNHLHNRFIESSAAGTRISYLLYLPPGYEETGVQRYPVVYWLHGIGGTNRGIPKYADRLTAAIAAGKMRPTIFVFPNGMIDSMWCDSTDGKTPVETALVQELIPHIDATLRTVASRKGRMIEGFSMGGFGAGRLGFKYPELFGSISMIDGAMLDLNSFKQGHADLHARIFSNDDAAFSSATPFALAEANASRVNGIPIRQIVGGLRGPNAAFHDTLNRLDIAHDYKVLDGVGHNRVKIYDRLGEDNWVFYRQAFAALKD